MTHFVLIGRPTLIFKVVKFYLAAGFIPAVKGITLDGKHETCARVDDVNAVSV